MHQFTTQIVSVVWEVVKMSEVGDYNGDSSLVREMDLQSGGGGHPVHDTSWQPRPFPMYMSRE